MLSRTKNNAICITTEKISKELHTNHFQVLNAVRSISDDSWLIHYIVLCSKQEIEFCVIIYDSSNDICFLNNELEIIEDLFTYVSEYFQAE